MGIGGKKNIDIVVAGHTCLDITPVFRAEASTGAKHFFTPGSLTNMAGVEIAAAGAVPNVGFCLAKLGLKIRLVGKVGKDLFGEGVLQYLRENGIPEGIAQTAGAATSYTIAISPPGVDRIFFHFPGANDTFTSGDIDYNIAEQARLFHFGYPPLMKKMYENHGCELVKIFKRVKELGVITSLDMAYIESLSESGGADWESILKRVLPYVDIYMPSIEETLFMLDRNYFDKNASKGSLAENLDVNILPALGSKLLTYGAKVVAIKCGVKGYYVKTQPGQVLKELSNLVPIDAGNWSNRELLAGAYKVKEIKSTTGAGDSSIAGFLAAFLNGLPIEETIKAANAVAAQSITAYDGAGNIKNFGTTLKKIKKGMPTIESDIKGTYWKYNKKLEIWKGAKDQS